MSGCDSPQAQCPPGQRACKYGAECYRLNKYHKEEFWHPPKKKSAASPSAMPATAAGPTRAINADYSATSLTASATPSKRSTTPPSRVDAAAVAKPQTFVTNKFGIAKIHIPGFPNDANRDTVTLRQLLRSDGLLEITFFTFVVDANWLMTQLPSHDASCAVCVVVGDQSAKENGDLTAQFAVFKNVSLIFARLPFPYGSHHTKMIVIKSISGLRIVITTANLIEPDWLCRSQGIWISDLYPTLISRTTNEVSSDTATTSVLSSPGGAVKRSHDGTLKSWLPSKPRSVVAGDSITRFKSDLLSYLKEYRLPALERLSKTIALYDLSSAKVALLASWPSRLSTVSTITAAGHIKLRQLLCARRENVAPIPHDWSLVAQFSSVGSYGANADKWIQSEFGMSCAPEVKSNLDVKLIYPCVDDVKNSLEGYAAGGCIAYTRAVALRQPWLPSLLHKWSAENTKRSRAAPHIKSYIRLSPDGRRAAWFALTSSNLSKAAWGSLEKNGSQHFVRSYELGVLFLPEYFDEGDAFHIGHSSASELPVPYDVPPVPYSSTDRPWLWDAAYSSPDCHGMTWPI